MSGPTLSVQPTTLAKIEPLREHFTAEADCQLIAYSALGRGIADPYEVLRGEELAGYGAVWNRYYEGRAMEFYVLPELRALALPMFRSLLRASGATHVEAQTNLPLMLGLLYDCCTDITVENVLFADEVDTQLTCPGGTFRRRTPEDEGPEGEWVIALDGEVAAAGGVLYHYNPPYGDIYMEVAQDHRGRGFGSYLVQELKRVCRASGRVPGARCDPGNEASRRTLEKAGMLPCGRRLQGVVVTREESTGVR